MPPKDSNSPPPQAPPTPPLPPTAPLETAWPNSINSTNGTYNTMYYFQGQGSSSNGASTYTRFFFVAITCLCLVASLVLFLHLYLRYIRRRHLQHHRRRTVDLFRLTNITGHTHSDSPRAGLDHTAISSIPSFQYQKEAHSSENTTTATAGGADDCAVCLSLLEEGEVARMLPACRHVFHVACIDKWLASSASCPVCRAEVQPQTQVQGRSRSRSLSRSQSAVGEATDAPVQDQSRTKEEAEVGGSVSTRLSSSFRRMLSGDRSSRRVQDDPMVEDLERGNGANPNE